MTRENDERDPYQKQTDENERSDRPQYHHDARRGETRYPPESGSEYGGVRDEADPHSRLNTPVSEVEEAAETDRLGIAGPGVDVAGMGRAQRSDTRGGAGDPEFGNRPDREEHNPAQSTPRGVLDPEAEAVRDVEERLGVDLGGKEPPVSGGGTTEQR